MLLVKVTVLLIVVTLIFWIAFRVWCENNQLRLITKDYPAWAYVFAYLNIADGILILACVIWFLFIYL